MPDTLRAQTAAAWDALLAPVLDHYESRPPPTRGRRHRRGHNLARTLWQEREACLRFLADPAVPFTNNRAERALRMAKLQMKISGSRTACPWLARLDFQHSICVRCQDMEGSDCRSAKSKLRFANERIHSATPKRTFS